MTRRKRYSAEFKREAISRANEEGVTEVLDIFLRLTWGGTIK